jgi:hypothetical protein
MSKKRTFAVVFICGFFSLFSFAALDGNWPNFSVASFLVFVGGLVVIALGFIWLESMYESRKNR